MNIACFFLTFWGRIFRTDFHILLWQNKTCQNRCIEKMFSGIASISPLFQWKKQISNVGTQTGVAGTGGRVFPLFWCDRLLEKLSRWQMYSATQSSLRCSKVQQGNLKIDCKWKLYWEWLSTPFRHCGMGRLIYVIRHHQPLASFNVHGEVEVLNMSVDPYTGWSQVKVQRSEGVK